MICTDAGHLSGIAERFNAIDSIGVEAARDLKRIVKILLFLLLLLLVVVILVADLLCGDIEKREDSIVGTDHQVTMRLGVQHEASWMLGLLGMLRELALEVVRLLNIVEDRDEFLFGFSVLKRMLNSEPVDHAVHLGHYNVLGCHYCAERDRLQL